MNDTKQLLSVDIGIRNLAFAVLEWQGMSPASWADITVRHWEKVDVLAENHCRVKNARHVPPLRLAQFVTQVLLNRPHFQVCETVLVESQPKAARMKSMATQICEHFRLCALLQNRPPPHVALQSGANKLKMDVDGSVTSDVNTWEERSYTQRKAEAVRRIPIILAKLHCPTEIQHVWQMEQNKKKKDQKLDDLADCLLQGLAYLQKNNTPPKKTAKRRRRTSDQA